MGISWLANELLYSQEEFWSMEFIKNFDSLLFNAAVSSVEQKEKMFLHRCLFQILLLRSRYRPV